MTLPLPESLRVAVKDRLRVEVVESVPLKVASREGSTTLAKEEGVEEALPEPLREAQLGVAEPLDVGEGDRDSVRVDRVDLEMLVLPVSVEVEACERLARAVMLGEGGALGVPRGGGVPWVDAETLGQALRVALPTPGVTVRLPVPPLGVALRVPPGTLRVPDCVCVAVGTPVAKAEPVPPLAVARAVL